MAAIFGKLCHMIFKVAILTLTFLAFAPTQGAIRPFSSDGQVISVNSGVSEQIYILTATNRTYFWNSTGKRRCCTCGDIVTVLGYSDTSVSMNPTAFATNIVVKGHSPLPHAEEISAADLLSGKITNRSVTIRGILVSVLRDELDTQWNWLILNNDGQSVFAAANESEYPISQLRKLLDAEVILRGFVGEIIEWRQFLGSLIVLFGENGISVTKPPAADPFAAPALGSTRTAHRQTTVGTVLGIGPDRVFLKTKDGKFLLVNTLQGSLAPPCGATVTASGFATKGHNSHLLTEATLRIEQDELAAPKTAYRVLPKELYPAPLGKDVANFHFFGKVIRLDGVIRDIFPSGSNDRRLKLDFGGHPVFVDLTTIRDISALAPNCEIDVSGVCYAEFITSPSCPFPRFGGFTIYPRGQKDIIIVRKAPWWTPTRFLLTVGILFSILIAVLVWNVLLHRISERRAKALAVEGMNLASAELKVEERTHLAVELHDALSQALTGVALQIETALDVDQQRESASHKFLKTAQQMLASCRQELRLCLWDLRSRTFQEKDMTEAILRTVSPHVGAAQLTVRFNVPREKLSESSAHAILKIVRELVVNAIRHGAATRVRIAGEYHDGEINFSVTDNGNGFDPDAAPGPADGHFGLQGIRERAVELGGCVHFESAPGQGARIDVRLIEREDDSDK